MNIKLILVLGVAVILLIYWRVTWCFAQRRKLAIKQTGEKWYHYASKEIFSERGQQFLRDNFAETFCKERVRFEGERHFVQTTALGAYLRLIEENAKDATRFDTLPIDRAAIAHARVLSRVAFPSGLPKDQI